MDVPDFFEKADDSELNPIRIMYNNRRWKYYYKITFVDYYQAYLNPFEFKSSGRLKFDYNNELKAFVINSNFKQFSQHGSDSLITFSTMENHHTICDWWICKDFVPLALMYDKNDVHVQVDEWLSISKRWINDAN